MFQKLFNYFVPAVLGALVGSVSTAIYMRSGHSDEVLRPYLSTLSGLLGVALGFAGGRYTDRKGDERKVRRRLRYELLRADKILVHLIGLNRQTEERERTGDPAIDDRYLKLVDWQVHEAATQLEALTEKAPAFEELVDTAEDAEHAAVVLSFFHMAHALAKQLVDGVDLTDGGGLRRIVVRSRISMLIDKQKEYRAAQRHFEAKLRTF